MSTSIEILGRTTIEVKPGQQNKVEMSITPASGADGWWIDMSRDAADVIASNIRYLNSESSYEPILRGVRVGGRILMEVETVGTAIVLVLRHGDETEFYPITLSQGSDLATALKETNK